MLNQIIRFKRYDILGNGENGKNGVIYDVYLPNEELSERELFLKKPEVCGAEDFEAMEDYIMALPEQTNLEERDWFSLRNFRHEFGTHGYAMPYHYEPSGLRLFCIRWNPNTLIICNGAPKDEDSVTWKEDPLLEPIGRICERIEIAIDREIKSGRYHADFLAPGFFKGNRKMTPSYDFTIPL